MARSIDSGIPSSQIVGPDWDHHHTAGFIEGSHTYATDGTYTVTVTLTDDDGGQNIKTFAITVYDNEPYLNIGGDSTVAEGSPYTLNLSSTGDATSLITGWTIDWGDGLIQNVSGNPSTVTHVFADGDAPSTISAVATDGTNTFSTGDVLEIVVDVTNVAPTLTDIDDQSIDEGQMLNLTTLATFTDPGFDNLSADPSTAETFCYQINWGDGSDVATYAPLITTSGALGIPTQGSFGGSHTYADNGVYTVTVTLTDDDDGQDTKTFQVTVNNVAPTLAVFDQTAFAGKLLNLPNLGTFTDPGFDNLLATPSTYETFTYEVDWGDGSDADTGTATIQTHGSLDILTQGVISGSHNYSTTGVYTVTVTLTDDDAGQNIKTFQVAVYDEEPVLSISGNSTAAEGALYTLNLSATGDSAEAITAWNIDWGDGQSQTFSSNPPSVTHTYSDNASYTISATATNGNQIFPLEDVPQLDVQVTNVAPTFKNIDNQVTTTSQALDLSALVEFSDPGFDNSQVTPATYEIFTYEVDWGDGSDPDTGTATIQTPGSPDILTRGMIDASHLYITYGIYTVTVTLADDDSGQSLETFQVTVGKPVGSASDLQAISDDLDAIYVLTGNIDALETVAMELR